MCVASVRVPGKLAENYIEKMGGVNMKNVEMSMEGKTLVIKVDTSKEFGLSKSGKTVIIASTEGNQTVDGVTVGLNVYRKK